MKKVKLSFIVPYKKRLENISLLFESLAGQTMGRDEFEVVVGSMEYCSAYADLCNRHADRLNIKTVISARQWQVAYARNMALCQACGEVTVFLDADMVLSPDFSRNLYDRHFSFGQSQCIIGQMVDYDNNTSDMTSIKVRPYAFYEKKLLEMEKNVAEMDVRFNSPHHIPWAFAWTALIAIPRRLILENELFFDLNFFGYGVEDLEWGYRISKAGIPMMLKKDVFGIHLPHLRNVNSNRETERRNYRYFLKKWPSFDVELACAFGDLEGNRRYPEFKNQIGKATSESAGILSVIKGVSGGKSVLIVGAITDRDGNPVNRDLYPELDRIEEWLPVSGLFLPFDDNSLDECIMMDSLSALDPEYQEIIKAESERVAKRAKAARSKFNFRLSGFGKALLGNHHH
ncbi:MAG: glycosyltransferase [Oligoflexales bacterium]|nr:glycosyltransferase [Oligoflexales bacterium]